MFMPNKLTTSESSSDENFAISPNLQQNYFPYYSVEECAAITLSPSIQINGRKILNLQPNWIGPPPSNSCELFIKKIPKDLNEYVLLPHFQRFGAVYEFRLMMDFNECNRGYGFIKYTNEEDTSRAMEVMNHFYVHPGKLLEIQKSYDKCRLFVANIPKELSEAELQVEFRSNFPSLERIVMHKRISDRNQNRGFVFLDFPNHEEALNVKKLTTPGRLRKWGRDIKIVWANPERCVDPDSMQNIKTLFVRNVDLTVNTKDIYAILTTQVKRSDIRKISRVREFAFIDFFSKEAAEKVLIGLNGVVLKGYSLRIEWAMPPSANSVHTLKNNDFDSVLRLKCIANYWSVPVIVFGRIFIKEHLQYVAIMIRENNVPRIFFMEIDTIKLTDIQSRACEVAVTLIEQIGQLPHYNYVLKVKDDNAYIVAIITNLETGEFIKAINITEDIYLYWNEIRDLSIAVSALTFYNDSQIISMYKNSFLQQTNATILSLLIRNDRLFGCIPPTYREKSPLKYKLNNTQVILALIHVATYSNYIFPMLDILYNFRDNGTEERYSPIQFSAINLLPMHFAQSKSTNTTYLNFVPFAPSSPTTTSTFNPVVMPPIWIGGNTYYEKVYDPETMQMLH